MNRDKENYTESKLVFFGKKQESITGIDIGTHELKLVELGGSLAKPELISWAKKTLPEGVFNENRIVDKSLLAQVLQALLAGAKSRSQQVAVSVSSVHAITKIIRMPGSYSEADIEEQIQLEALHLIPYPIDEVNLDFQLLGPSADNSKDNDVLLVACRCDIINDYIDVLESLDLIVKYIDVDIYALERAYRVTNRENNEQQSKSNFPLSLIDIGLSHSLFVVLNDQRVLYSRQYDVGSTTLINIMCREYGLSPHESLKVLASNSKPLDFHERVVTPFVKELSQELVRCLQYFYSSSRHNKVKQIVLSGGVCNLPKLVNGLNAIMDIEVMSRHVSCQIGSPRAIKQWNNEAQSLVVAYGLSLRGLI